MPKPDSNRVALMQGTLDMLVLRSLLLGSAHGHAIVKLIQQLSDEALQVDHGSLYPALNRLLKQRWIAANWEQMPDKNRQARYYRLTPAGRKQLTAEESKWERLAQAIAKVMKRRPEEV
jgi:PadR family transcriptional regulator, regulatory protein PadR